MRRLNRVLYVSNQKHLVTRVSQNQCQTLKIGQEVVSEDLTRIGRIFDIFGPINHPFVSIKLNAEKEPEHFVGEIIYTFEGEKSKKRRRN